MAEKWVKMLDEEVNAKNEQIVSLIKEENGLYDLELRGLCVGDVKLVGDVRHPIHDRLITFSKRNTKSMRGFRPRTPVTVHVIRDKKLKPVLEGSIRSIERDRIEIRSGESFKLPENSEFFISPSQVKSVNQTLKSIISSSEMRKGAGVNLIEFAFRAKPMPSVHSKKVRKVSEELNEEQAWAVSSALDEKRPFLCIQGPPGTGKTRVIAEIVRLLLEKDKKVLVCAPSHVAVDNAFSACSKAIHNDRLDEICVYENIEEAVLKHDKYEKLETLADGMKSMNAKEKKDRNHGIKQLQHYIYKDIYKKHRAIFCTLTSSVIRSLPRMAWNADVIIIDEAAQCTEPQVWAAISTCKRCILVGDPAQLPAVVVSKSAQQEGLHVSLMERLMKEFSKSNISVLLKQQFRMNDKIMKFSSDNFYDSQLVSSDCVKDITLSDKFNMETEDVLNHPVIMFDTDKIWSRSRESRSQYSKVNEDEADLVVSYVNRLLLEHDVGQEQIAIITPYFAQAEKIRKKLRWPVKVNTVDAFQGQEKEIVIFCLVRDNSYGQIGFLKESRRLNVAITRAKRQFVLIGSSKIMETDDFLTKLLRYVEKEGKILDPTVLVE